jgi:hypothetical protein
MTLYRTGRAETPDGFWTPDPEYAHYIRVGDRPMIKAELLDTARVKKLPGSPSPAVIDRERAIGDADVLVFEAWDWDTQEYVVLNTAVLSSVEAFGG